jgi:hypothetical protein
LYRNERENAGLLGVPEMLSRTTTGFASFLNETHPFGFNLVEEFFQGAHHTHCTPSINLLIGWCNSTRRVASFRASPRQIHAQ